MKILFTIIIIVTSNFISNSQDLIILNSDDTINCKIIEDKITFLRYKLNINDTIVYNIDQSKYNFYLKRESEVKNEESKSKSDYILNFLQSKKEAQKDTIMTKKVFGGYQYHYNNHILTFKEIQVVLKHNNESFKEVEIANRRYSLVGVLSCVGSGLIGWTLGWANSGARTNWTPAVVGLCFIGISIPININVNRHRKSAIDIYNKHQLQNE